MSFRIVEKSTMAKDRYKNTCMNINFAIILIKINYSHLQL